MDRVVGVRFRENGKIYHFDQGELDLKKGDYVIVHTERGMGFGQVVDEGYPRECCQRHDLKTVERLATEEEIQKHYENLKFERDCKEYCLERIDAHQLPMHLVDVEYLYDGSKIIFYFTAEGRVDFRELLKDLVRRLRVRVELRQIGVRNQAKMVGGLGNCGLPVCCATFLDKFHPVSIKMAKEQNLSLNPTKISGACGRLLCCLQYEHKTYQEMKQGMPKMGKKITLSEGRGKVIRQNILQRTFTVLLEDGKEVEKTMDAYLKEARKAKGRGD